MCLNCVVLQEIHQHSCLRIVCLRFYALKLLLVQKMRIQFYTCQLSLLLVILVSVTNCDDPRNYVLTDDIISYDDYSDPLEEIGEIGGIGIGAEIDLDDTGPPDADDDDDVLGLKLESRVRYQPRHIHISYGDEPTSMYITWSTIDNPENETIVEYGVHDDLASKKLPLTFDTNIFKYKTLGSMTQFTETGPAKLTQYIHRVLLKNLVQGKTYVYHCGSNLGWSEIFWFTAMPPGTDWSPKLAIFGDMGNENAKSLTRLQREVQMNVYDAIIHVGDFAYDMDEDDGKIGDSFMEQIQPIAAYVPYMTCPGNHEYRDNFLQYKNRFTMPGNYESMMYSFNLGPIHFIGFSTEFYYFLQYGIKPLVEQYEWIKADLEEANKPENREKQPWIVTYGHRPMYCSNNDSDDCTKHDTLVRVGIPYVHWFGLEDLFMRNGVDLTIWAHEHSYERLWPLYNHKVYNGTREDPYKNPRALVHVTTGSAGCREKHDEYAGDMPEWSAYRSTDYGYSRLTALNRTHMHFEQVSDDQDGRIIDSFTLVRDNHAPFPFP